MKQLYKLAEDLDNIGKHQEADNMTVIATNFYKLIKTKLIEYCSDANIAVSFLKYILSPSNRILIEQLEKCMRAATQGDESQLTAGADLILQKFIQFFKFSDNIANILPKNYRIDRLTCLKKVLKICLTRQHSGIGMVADVAEVAPELLQEIKRGKNRAKVETFYHNDLATSAN